MNLRYIYKPNEEDIGNSFRPGKVRNLGAKLAKGQFIYTNDADIIFKNQNYLSSLIKRLESNPDMAFHRPKMRRMPLECFDEFLRRINEVGIRKTIDSLNYQQDFLATTDEIVRKLKVVKRIRNGEEKIVTTSLENFQRYISDSSLKGQEPTIWSHDVHCGGTFMRKSQFETVGGYCEEFRTWGCEDSDLQWKLAQCFDLQFIPGEPQFEVLHMDHPKKYFSSDMLKSNNSIQENRRILGISEIIKRDKEVYFR